MKQLKKYIQFLCIVCVIGISQIGYAQKSRVLYSNTLQGGVTMVSNAFKYAPTQNSKVETSTTPWTSKSAWINVDPSPVSQVNKTNISSKGTLMLPDDAVIVKAYLMLETTFAGTNAFSDLLYQQCYIKTNAGKNANQWVHLPAADPTPLTGTMAYSSNGTYHQSWWDITDIVKEGGASDYTVADPSARDHTGNMASNPDDVDLGGGWTIMVVYSSPNSKFRNIVIAQNAQFFTPGTSANTEISGVVVPRVSPVNAVVGITGSYGDRDWANGSNRYKDYVFFGKYIDDTNYDNTKTILKNPVTNVTDDALGSTIGFDKNNNVTNDGRTGVPVGNYTARVPNDQQTGLYDASIFSAYNILPANTTATPAYPPATINVRFQQQSISGGSDDLYSGFYFVSVDISGAHLDKKLTDINGNPAPTGGYVTIGDGGTANYVFTITNKDAGGYDQNGLSFTDNLPASITPVSTASPKIDIIKGDAATFPGAGTTKLGTVTVTGTTISLSSTNLAWGDTITFTVPIKNVSGKTNPNPICGDGGAFTNSVSNISPITNNLGAGFAPQCLKVLDCTAGNIAPTLTPTGPVDLCTAKSYDLTTITYTPALPTGTTLRWYSDAALTTVVSNPNAVTGGTYYAAYYDAVHTCNSPSTTFVVRDCIKANDDSYSINAVTSGTTYTTPASILINDTKNTVAPVTVTDITSPIVKIGVYSDYAATTVSPQAGNFTINADGTITVSNLATIPAGTYYLKYQLTNINYSANVTTAIASFTITRGCTASPNTTAGTGAKVGISTYSDMPSGWPGNVTGAQLAIDSNRPLLISSVDTSKISVPQAGMFVYDTVNKCFAYYNGSAWKCLKKCGN